MAKILTVLPILVRNPIMVGKENTGCEIIKSWKWLFFNQRYEYNIFVFLCVVINVSLRSKVTEKKRSFNWIAESCELYWAVQQNILVTNWYSKQCKQKKKQKILEKKWERKLNWVKTIPHRLKPDLGELRLLENKLCKFVFSKIIPKQNI